MKLKTTLKISVLLACLFITNNSFAQKNKSYTKNTHGYSECPQFYLGLNLGIDNPNGIVGISFDVPVVAHVSGRAGVGLSSWGFKYYGEGVGYLGDCHRSWAAGLGISRNTGISEMNLSISTNSGTEEAVVRLLPQTNAFINLYHYFNLGKKKSRFYVQLGYSVPLSDKPYYKIKSGDVLSEDAKKVMKVLRPGGLSVGVGFYFNVSSKK